MADNMRRQPSSRKSRGGTAAGLPLPPAPLSQQTSDALFAARYRPSTVAAPPPPVAAAGARPFTSSSAGRPASSRHSFNEEAAAPAPIRPLSSGSLRPFSEGGRPRTAASASAGAAPPRSHRLSATTSRPSASAREYGSRPRTHAKEQRSVGDRLMSPHTHAHVDPSSSSHHQQHAHGGDGGSSSSNNNNTNYNNNGHCHNSAWTQEESSAPLSPHNGYYAPPSSLGGQADAQWDSEQEQGERDECHRGGGLEDDVEFIDHHTPADAPIYSTKNGRSFATQAPRAAPSSGIQVYRYIENDPLATVLSAPTHIHSPKNHMTKAPHRPPPVYENAQLFTCDLAKFSGWFQRNRSRAPRSTSHLEDYGWDGFDTSTTMEFRRRTDDFLRWNEKACLQERIRK